MKTNFSLVALGVAGILSMGGLSSRADLEVGASFSIHAEADFHAPLAAHGAWITVGNYGRCWRPAGVAVSWRPYCTGHWIWTDCGWYWESDEPWGWACYHYGRWVYDPVNYWIWVPGIQWAPAWVEWRVGGGYIGWAPLPPPGVSITLGAPHFVFVQSGRFNERIQPSTVVVNQTTIINNTKVINNVRQETRTISGTAQKVMVNEGPGVAAVQQATGKTVKPTPVRELAERAPVPAEIKAKGRGAKADDTTTTTGRSKSEVKEQKSEPAQTPREQPAQPTAPNRDVEKQKQQPKEKPYVAPPADSPRAPSEKKSQSSERPERSQQAAPPPGQYKQQPNQGYERPRQTPPTGSQPARPAHEPGGQGKGAGKDREHKDKP